MTKREMMIKAHEMARKMVGDYSARLSLALRTLWAAVKKGLKKMIKVTGNTYQAKSILKDCGFTYDAENKCWNGNDEALVELKRVSTASYSRANQKLVAGLKFEEV
jgi:hypothetical protein